MSLIKIMILVMFVVLGGLAIYQEGLKHQALSIDEGQNSPAILIAKDGTSPGV